MQDKSLDVLSLNCNGVALDFTKADLEFSDPGLGVPVWAKKNNKSVRETLAHPKYAKLSALCETYRAELDKPLGEFLLGLMECGDEFYRRFLNSDGEAEFTVFSLADSTLAKVRGLYLYEVKGEVVYIGRCLDSFAKRINQGYGKIHPKNCYIDGQRTNCRLNALVSANQGDVALYVCPMSSEQDIIRLETALLKIYRPGWNKQFA
ncbi:MAG: hypothetical protein WCK51_15675 [Armatimonadota bacterium]